MLPPTSGGGVDAPAGLLPVFGLTLGVGVGLSGARFTLLGVFAPSPLVLTALGRGAVALAWLTRPGRANSDKSISNSQMPIHAVNRVAAARGSMAGSQTGCRASVTPLGVILVGTISIFFITTIPLSFALNGNRRCYRA